MTFRLKVPTLLAAAYLMVFCLAVLTGCSGVLGGDEAERRGGGAVGEADGADRYQRAPAAANPAASSGGGDAGAVAPSAGNAMQINPAMSGSMADADDYEAEEGEAAEEAIDAMAAAPAAAAIAPAAPRYDGSSYSELPRRPRPPADMRFEDAGVNRWQEASRDALSTFAVDVDTGSYPLVRRYLADDLLPPITAVRPEEVLNYFSEAYDYAPPMLGTFAVHADAAPSPFGRREHVLRIGVKGREIRERRRAPLALTLVIDVSGSMKDGGRLELVKDGLINLVERLEPEDDLAIVSYSTNARAVLRRTSMTTSGRDAAIDAIDGLRPTNSTNAEAGLTLGYDLADAGWRGDAVNKVVLASDGVANVGSTGPGTILQRIGDYVRRDITLTAIGVGMGNYNDALLEQLADRGDGSYHYIDDHAEMRRVLIDGLVETLQPIALDAKVQVEFDTDNVYAWRLIGYENRDVADRDFENDAVDAGEIGAGQSVTALYELELVREPRGSLATVRVRWQDPDSGEVEETDERIGVGALADSFDDASAGLRLATAAAGFAELLRDGPWAREIRFDEVADIAFDVADERERMRGDEVAELARLAEQAGWLTDGVGYGGRVEDDERVGRYDRGGYRSPRERSRRP